MKIRLLLIAEKSERFIAAANEALDAAFPGSDVVTAASLIEAAQMPQPDIPEMIAIEGASGPQIAEAAAALDDQKLPRWAVVASGSSPAPRFTEVLPASEWAPGPLARVFRTSMELHLLRRDRDRLLGDLLSVGMRVTHDLRTPLGGILSATEALEEIIGKGPNGERPPTQPILESAQDLVKIISQLTLVTKATAKPSLPKAFPMATAAGRALERVEARAQREGAEISKPSSWPEVTGDPAKAESVWHLLLENALRHGGRRPKIAIGWDKADHGYRFWVRDNGPGVAPERLRLLFHPFHRLHEPNAARGFGLAIAGRLMSLQGGRCGHEVPAQGGACFFFTLPSAEKT